MSNVVPLKSQALASLPLLIKAIKEHIDKGNQTADKSEQHYISAGQHLADAKLRLEAKNKTIRSQKKSERTEQPQSWKDFVKEHFEFNQQKADLYIAVSDGRKPIAKLRAEQTERKQVERKRKSTVTSRSKSKEEKAPSHNSDAQLDEVDLVSYDPDDPNMVEDPGVIKEGILDTIDRHGAVAKTYGKILKVASLDQEAKDEVTAAINKLMTKWRSVCRTLSASPKNIKADRSESDQQADGTVH